MLFYDQNVTNYVLCVAVPGASDVLPVEVQLGATQPGHDYARFYDRIGQATVDYLNDGVLFGTIPRDDASPEQKENFRKHLPTGEEEEVLRRFLDEVVTTNDIIEAKFFADDVPTPVSCRLRLFIEEGEGGQLYPTVRHSFENAFDLFLFECYELLKEGHLKKCLQCGRYFFPGKSKAKFCSGPCRSASHSVNSSPEYKAYRRANDTKNKQLNRGQITHEAYNQWQSEAKGALDAYCNGRIAWDEYENVLKRDLRKK